MEQEPRESELIRAQTMTERALTLVEDPSRIQFYHRYYSILEEGYSLEVRTSARIGDLKYKPDDHRFIYVTSHPKGNHRMSFSLELNALLNGKEDGHTTDYYSLVEALEHTPLTKPGERALLRTTYEVMRRIDTDGQASREQLDELQSCYLALIEQGASITIKDFTHKFSDDSWMAVRGTVVEGPIKYLWPDELSQPKIQIRLLRKGDELENVVQHSQDGYFETFVQDPDKWKRIEAYINPEDIIRDKDGNMVGIRTNIDYEKIMVEAERAAGTRALTHAQLDIVAKYLDQLAAETDG